MKIALCVRVIYPSHGYGGLEKFVFFLAKELVKKGHRVHILTSSAGNKKLKKTEFEGITYIHFPVKIHGVFLPFQLFRNHILIKKIAEYIKDSDYDIAHCFGEYAFYYNLFYKKKCKTAILSQAFDNESFKIELWKRIILFLPINLPLKKSIKSSDVVASCGPHQDKEILSIYRIPENKIKRIKDGVEAEHINKIISDLRDKKDEIRGKYDISKEDFVIINVNRLASTKNVDMIIKALKEIKQEIKFKFILVGSGPEEQKINTLIKSYGLKGNCMHFKGVSNNTLYELLSISNVFVEASIIENIVLTALEAIAAEIPVISFHDQEGIISENTGFLVKEKNHKSIAKMFRAVYNIKDLDKISKNAFIKIKSNDWSKVADEAINAYSFAISNKKKDI